MPAVADRQPREAVAAAAHGDRQPALLGEANRRTHVRDAGAARDQRRTAVDRAVPDPPVGVVAGVVRANELAPEGRLQLAKLSLVECGNVGGSHRVLPSCVRGLPIVARRRGVF